METLEDPEPWKDEEPEQDWEGRWEGHGCAVAVLVCVGVTAVILAWIVFLRTVM